MKHTKPLKHQKQIKEKENVSNLRHFREHYVGFSQNNKRNGMKTLGIYFKHLENCTYISLLPKRRLDLICFVVFFW
jgi:hypothetical protein